MELKRKDFTYRGKTIDELKAMDVREFAKYLEARSRRTVLRQFQEIEQFVAMAKEKVTRGKRIKTHKRDIIIVPEMVGMNMQVYDGHSFVPVEVIGEMLGRRLGEFAITRKKVSHGAAGIGATKGSKAQSKK